MFKVVRIYRRRTYGARSITSNALSKEKLQLCNLKLIIPTSLEGVKITCKVCRLNETYLPSYGVKIFHFYFAQFSRLFWQYGMGEMMGMKQRIGDKTVSVQRVVSCKTSGDRLWYEKKMNRGRSGPLRSSKSSSSIHVKEPAPSYPTFPLFLRETNSGKYIVRRCIADGRTNGNDSGIVRAAFVLPSQQPP